MCPSTGTGSVWQWRAKWRLRGRKLEERAWPASIKPTIGGPFHGLLPSWRIKRRASRLAPTSKTRLRGAAETGVEATYRIISGVLFMNRPRSLGLYPDDLATVEPSRGPDPVLSILGLTILGSPHAIRFSLKLFDRPNRR